MPAGDRTGPAGMGPMTGRRAGYCGGYGAPGFANPAGGGVPAAGFGRGGGFRGRGFGGGGRGWRHWFHATGLPRWMRGNDTPTPEQKPDPQAEKQALRSQVEALEAEMDFIKRRLGEIEKGSQTE